MLLLLLAFLSPQSTPVAVAIDAQKIGPAQFRALDVVGLERHLMARLVQEGFAVVSLKGQPDLVLQLTLEANAVVLALGGRQRAIPLRSDLPAVHLEVVQRGAQLARAGRAELPAQPPPSKPPAVQQLPEPGAPRLSKTSTAPAPKATRASIPQPRETPVAATSRFALAVGLGVLGRDHGVDMQVRLQGRYGFGVGALRGRGGLGLRLDTALSPPLRQAFRVVDWQLQAGIDYRAWLTGTWFLEIGALLGAVLHRFSSPTTLPGTRLDMLASLPLAFGGVVSASWSAQIFVAPGISEERREHRVGGNLVWSRGALRLVAGFTLAWAP